MFLGFGFLYIILLFYPLRYYLKFNTMRIIIGPTNVYRGTANGLLNTWAFTQ
jgi:hypothetical protein